MLVVSRFGNVWVLVICIICIKPLVDIHMYKSIYFKDIDTCWLFSPDFSLAERIETPTQLKELVSDLSSQFVFSPPTLRTKKKNISSTSRLIDELVRKTYLCVCLLKHPFIFQINVF